MDKWIEHIQGNAQIFNDWLLAQPIGKFTGDERLLQECLTKFNLRGYSELGRIKEIAEAYENHLQTLVRAIAFNGSTYYDNKNKIFFIGGYRGRGLELNERSKIVVYTKSGNLVDKHIGGNEGFYQTKFDIKILE